MNPKNEIYQRAADAMGCSIEDVEGVVDAANRETGGKYQADTIIYPTGKAADTPDTSAMNRSDRRKADRQKPKRRRAVRFG